MTLCGLFVDPEAAEASLQGLAGMLPAGTAEVARDALGPIGAAGLAAAVAAGALWCATVAALQLFGALNVAYGKRETRGLVRLCATAVLFALGTMAFVGLVLGGVLAVPVALGADAGPGGIRPGPVDHTNLHLGQRHRMMATATMSWALPKPVWRCTGLQETRRPILRAWPEGWVLPIERSLPNGGRSGLLPILKRSHAQLDSTV